MNVRSRNKFIDLIKGFAIILVVAGHCIQSGCGGQYSASNIYWENYLFKFIYGFHMPLFAMVSGYLFYYSIQKRNLIGIVCQRIMTIGIPISIWCGIMLIVDYRDIAFLEGWGGNKFSFLLPSSTGKLTLVSMGLTGKFVSGNR